MAQHPSRSSGDDSRDVYYLCGDDLNWLDMTNQTIEQAVEERAQKITDLFFEAGARVSKTHYDYVVEALQAQRDAGYRQCLLEIKHEQRKLLDGFSHPKDCAMCLTPPTK